MSTDIDREAIQKMRSSVGEFAYILGKFTALSLKVKAETEKLINSLDKIIIDLGKGDGE